MELIWKHLSVKVLDFVFETWQSMMKEMYTKPGGLF